MSSGVCPLTELTSLLFPWLLQALSSTFPTEYGTAWRLRTQHQQTQREAWTLPQTAANDHVCGSWATGDRCSEGSCAMGLLKCCIWLISTAARKKHSVGIPRPVAAACSLLSRAVKRDHKEKKLLPAMLLAGLGPCTLPPPSRCFVLFCFSVSRKKTASVCQLT